MVIINTLNLKIPAMKRKSLLCLFLIISVAIHGNIYFKHLGKSDGLSQISVLSICQDELDRMWFGTLEGLNCYDGNQMKTYKPSPDNKDYFGGNEISHIVSDKQGNLSVMIYIKIVFYLYHYAHKLYSHTTIQYGQLLMIVSSNGTGNKKHSDSSTKPLSIKQSSAFM